MFKRKYSKGTAALDGGVGHTALDIRLRWTYGIGGNTFEATLAFEMKVELK